MITLSCQPVGHRYCVDCFKDYCTFKIGEAQVDRSALVCPFEGCKMPITPHELKAHVSEESYAKFERFGLRNLCSENGWKCCPHCNNWFADIPTDEGSVSVWRKIRCQDENCSKEFCGRCGQEPHAKIEVQFFFV